MLHYVRMETSKLVVARKIRCRIRRLGGDIIISNCVALLEVADVKGSCRTPSKRVINLPLHLGLSQDILK